MDLRAQPQSRPSRQGLFEERPEPRTCAPLTSNKRPGGPTWCPSQSFAREHQGHMVSDTRGKAGSTPPKRVVQGGETKMASTCPEKGRWQIQRARSAQAKSNAGEKDKSRFQPRSARAFETPPAPPAISMKWKRKPKGREGEEALGNSMDALQSQDRSCEAWTALWLLSLAIGGSPESSSSRGMTLAFLEGGSKIGRRERA